MLRVRFHNDHEPNNLTLPSPIVLYMETETEAIQYAQEHNYASFDAEAISKH